METPLTLPGRNEPCWCGSGRKYKNCHYAQDRAAAVPLWQRVRRVEVDTIMRVGQWGEERYGLEAMRAAVRSLTDRERAVAGRVAEPEEEWPAFQMLLLISALRPQGLEPGATLAGQYLREHGAGLDEPTRLLLEGVDRQPLSFFQVRDCQPGVGIGLRDVLLGREFFVQEQAASREVYPGVILFGRVIPAGSEHLLMRLAPMGFPPDRLEQVLQWRQDYAPLGSELLRGLGEDLLDLYFTMRHQVRHPERPKMMNTHGEDLEFQTLSYRLNLGIREAVEKLASLGPETVEELLEQAQRDPRGGLKRVGVVWTGPDKAGVFGGAPVTQGNLSITAKRLKVEVNSAKRAAKIRALIEKRLGAAAVFQGAKIQAAETMMKGKGGAPGGPGSDVGVTFASNRISVSASAVKPGQDPMDVPEVRDQIQAMARQHWAGWLDQALPALQGQSPRQAAKNPAGRELLEALFYEFEARATKGNLMAPDVPELKRQLGLR